MARANKDSAFGLRPIGKIGQNRDNQGLSEYSITANDSTTIFFQDAVSATAAGTIHQAAASEAFLLGALNGVFYTDPTTSKPTFANHYSQVNASDISAFVADDPYERFEIQSNKATAHTQSDIFQNCNMEVTAGDSANFVSKSEIDIAGGTTTGTAQLKITGVSNDIDNSNLTHASGHVNFVVMINEHLYNAKNNGI